MEKDKQRLKPGAAFGQIYERLKKSRAFPQELIHELGLSDRTVDIALNYGINAQILEKSGHGYGIKGHEVKYKVIAAYEKLTKKFRRKPPLEAVAAEMDESSEETEKLLLKYIHPYREPSEKEMEESAKEIQRLLVWKYWTDQKLDKRNFKRWGLEKGIKILEYSGIDSDIISDIINKQNMPSVAEVKKYSKEFPELGIEVKEKKDQEIMSFEFEWSEYTKKTFDMLPDKLKPWEKKGQIPLPRYLDTTKYDRYKKSIVNDPSYVLDRIRDLARDCVPDEDVIEDCLSWIRDANFKYREEILKILRSFRKNAKDCEMISTEKEEAITDTLNKIAFVKENDKSLRLLALEFTILINPKKANDMAKAFCLESIKKGYESGSYILNVAKLICGDPKIKEEIKEEAEKIILESSDEKLRNDVKTFLQNI